VAVLDSHWRCPGCRWSLLDRGRVAPCGRHHPLPAAVRAAGETDRNPIHPPPPITPSAFYRKQRVVLRRIEHDVA
jgi:hypothetical protein